MPQKESNISVACPSWECRSDTKGSVVTTPCSGAHDRTICETWWVYQLVKNDIWIHSAILACNQLWIWSNNRQVKHRCEDVFARMWHCVAFPMELRAVLYFDVQPTETLPSLITPFHQFQSAIAQINFRSIFDFDWNVCRSSKLLEMFRYKLSLLGNIPFERQTNANQCLYDLAKLIVCQDLFKTHAKFT